MPRVHDSKRLFDATLVSSKKILHHDALTILTRLVLLLPPMQVVLRRRVKDIEEPLPLIAHLKHTRHIPAPVAVVRRAPDRTQPIVVQDLIALLAELVRAQDVVHLVDIEELLHHLCAKGVARASWRQ